MYICKSWTTEKAEHQRMEAFELWCCRRLLRVWTTRRTNQSILKEINPEYSLEGLMLKLKFQNFVHRCEETTHWKRPWCLERFMGVTENYMVGWHHWLNGHVFEQTPGDNEGQGSLVCYSTWGHKDSGTLRDWTRRSPDSGKMSDIFTSIVENSKENTVSGEAKVAVTFFNLN